MIAESPVGLVIHRHGFVDSDPEQGTRTDVDVTLTVQVFRVFILSPSGANVQVTYPEVRDADERYGLLARAGADIQETPNESLVDEVRLPDGFTYRLRAILALQTGTDVYGYSVHLKRVY